MKVLELLISATAVLSLASIGWAATLQGDCDNSGTVEIFKMQRCVNSFLDPETLSQCLPCDQNGDGDVDIGEVQGAANCFRDTSSPGCLMITPQATAAPTDTPTPVPTDTVPLATDTPTPMPTDTPASTPTATEGMALCGNGILESPPESCDDGNTTEGCVATGCDACPSNCVIQSCVPGGTTTVVDVNFQSPVNLNSITISLRYPDGTVQIPGTQNDASVLARLTNRLPGFFFGVDFDYLLRVVVSGGAFPRTRIATVTFDNCTDAPPVTAGDFVCAVQEAQSTDFMLVQGVTCSVSFP